jgi:glutamate-1-semialdehyde 2,1-aminomutase
MKVNPDMVVYGKTIANGIPMAAIVGRREIISQSLKTFISSAFWTERVGPACALAFIKKHRKLNAGKKLNIIGKQIKKIWLNAAKKNNLKIEIQGIDPLASFRLVTKDWPVTITFFIQEMLKKNILASDRCYANLKHTKRVLNIYRKACEDVFQKISQLENDGTLKSHLDGPIKQMGFARLTEKK